MTSFARQVRRRQERSIEHRLRALGMVKPNFEPTFDVPEPEKKPGKQIPGHLAVMSPRKKRRSAVKAARKANRG